MVFETSATLKDRFRQARRSVVEMFPGRRRPGQTYQGYVKARRRLTRRHRRVLTAHLRRHHRRLAGRFWRRDGWLAFAADGTRIEVPRTAPNEKAFGCAGRKKTGPQLTLTSVYHLGTGLPWAWRIGAGIESEQTHLRQMVGLLPAGSLLVADAGLTGFDLLRSLWDHHVEVLVRMGANRTLLTGLKETRVRVAGDVVWLWPTARQATCPPLMLRLLRLERANHSPLYLVTSVMDERALSRRQIGVFYRMRWGQEVFHRSFKRTFQQYRLRSDAPGEARQELEWALIAYVVLGLWSVEALIGAGRDPLTWSVAASLHLVRGLLRWSGGQGRRVALTVRLRVAVKDTYVRHGPKRARAWPHKKNDSPPGRPKIRAATEKEKHCARSTYDKVDTG